MSDQPTLPANFKDLIKPLFSLVAHSSQLDEVALLTRLDTIANDDIGTMVELLITAIGNSPYIDESTVISVIPVGDADGTVTGLKVAFIEMAENGNQGTNFMNVACVSQNITFGGIGFLVSEKPISHTHKSPSSFVSLVEPLPTIKRKLAALNDASLLQISEYLNNLENTDSEGDDIIIELLDSLDMMLTGPYPLARKLTRFLPTFTSLVDKVLGSNSAYRRLAEVSQHKKGQPLNNQDIIRVFADYINVKNNDTSALEVDFETNTLRTTAQGINVYFNIPGLEEVILHLGVEEDILLVTNFGEFNLSGECNFYLDELTERLSQEDKHGVYCQQMIRLLTIVRQWIKQGPEREKLRTLNHTQRLLASVSTVQIVRP